MTAQKERSVACKQSRRTETASPVPSSRSGAAGDGAVPRRLSKLSSLKNDTPDPPTSSRLNLPERPESHDRFPGYRGQQSHPSDSRLHAHTHIHTNEHPDAHAATERYGTTAPSSERVSGSPASFSPPLAEHAALFFLQRLALKKQKKTLPGWEGG